MLLSKGTPLVLGLSILLLGLSGCAQTPTISQADREAYLQQFIGQSWYFRKHSGGYFEKYGTGLSKNARMVYCLGGTFLCACNFIGK